MRVALDTNILVYAEGANDASHQAKARALVKALPAAATVVPVQVLGELFRVLTRKASLPPQRARERVLQWSDTFECVPTSFTTMVAAIDISAAHGLAIWDSVILAAAAEAGCRLLLSEDLQAGFTWQGVTVTNPLVTPQHPLLDAILVPPT